MPRPGVGRRAYGHDRLRGGRHLPRQPDLPVPLPDADHRRPARRHLRPQANSSAVVLNLAFDPTPGASVQKLVRVANAVNGAFDRRQLPRARRVRLQRLLPQPMPQHDERGPGGHDLRDVRVGRLDPVQAHRRQQRRPATDRRDGRRLDGRDRLRVPDDLGRGLLEQPRAAPTTAPLPTCPTGQTADQLRQRGDGRRQRDPARSRTASPSPSSRRRPTGRSTSTSARSRSATTATAPAEQQPDFKNVTALSQGENAADERVRVVPGRDPEHRRISGHRRHDLLDAGRHPVQPEQPQPGRVPRDADDDEPRGGSGVHLSLQGGRRDTGGHPEHGHGQLVERRPARSEQQSPRPRSPAAPTRPR